MEIPETKRFLPRGFELSRKPWVSRTGLFNTLETRLTATSLFIVVITATFSRPAEQPYIFINAVTR